MNFSEIKEQSYQKILLIAPSGRGKTFNASRAALEVSREGRSVLYLDTEAEGSTTIVQLVESSKYDYEEGDVENITYEQIGTYTELMEFVDKDNGYHDMFDLIIIDTLDHKHTFALKEVTDARKESDAEWNEYPQIYSAEKQVMEKLGKPGTNILATIDPDSGKSDKPKGAQTNVIGYFTAVIELKKTGDGWGNKVINYVGRSDIIGGNVADLDVYELVAKEVLQRS